MKKVFGLIASCLAIGLISCGQTSASSAHPSTPASQSDVPVSTPISETKSSENQPAVISDPVTSPVKSEGEQPIQSGQEQPIQSEASPDESKSGYLAPLTDTITTKPMQGLPASFIMGMDASAVPSLERSGVTYHDADGNVEDVYKILADHGVTHIRVRIWNDPYDAEGHGYGGGNCDLANAIAIGKRATANGMKLIANFHYSDFWADPKVQKAPKAWASMTLEAKKTALYNYTRASLQSMLNENIDVGMVQIGNETTNGLAGETDWTNIAALMKEGSRATREIYPNALIAVHFTNPEKKRFLNYAKTLNDNGVDYDVFGTSFYPYWHGTLQNLSEQLSLVNERYGKQTMILETSYCNTSTDSDYFGNTSPKDGDVLPHEVSLQGQYDQIYDVISTANSTTGCLGVCYWEGTWISVNAGDYYKNLAKWEEFGSGWATSYSAAYLPEIVGTWYGGSAVDNEAFFNQYGQMYPSIEVFNIERESDEEPEKPAGSLQNLSFESALAPWEIEILTPGTASIGTAAIKTDAKTDGTSSLNLWDASAIEFNLKQKVENLPAGSHTFKISLMGASDSFEMNLFAKHGTQVDTATAGLTGWENWNEYSLTFELEERCDVEVGVHFNWKASGSWAYVDGASLS